MGTTKIIKLEDWSELDTNKNNKIDIGCLKIGCFKIADKAEKNNAKVNLGIHRNTKWGNGELWTAGYVGVQWVQWSPEKECDKETSNERPVILVRPRFGGGGEVIAKMLGKVIDDEEFEKYYESEDERGNKLFEVIENEEIIYLKSEQTEDFFVFQAIMFLSLLNKLCRSTIRYQSITVKENLIGKVKGKILFNKQIKHNITHGREDRVYCQYQKFSMDCLENQILKAALEKSWLYLASKNLLQPRLVELYSYCSSVLASVTLREISRHDFAGLKFNSVFKHYKLPIQYAKWIIQGISFIQTSKGGTGSEVIRGIPPHYINVHQLFEFYCRAIVRQALKNKDLEDWTMCEYVPFNKLKRQKDSKNIPYHICAGGSKAEHISPFIIPDIWLRKKNNSSEKESVSMILEVKYRELKGGYNDRDITHQLFSYGYQFKADYLALIHPPDRDGAEHNNVQNMFEFLQQLTQVTQEKHGEKLVWRLKSDECRRYGQLHVWL